MNMKLKKEILMLTAFALLFCAGAAKALDVNPGGEKVKTPEKKSVCPPGYDVSRDASGRSWCVVDASKTDAGRLKQAEIEGIAYLKIIGDADDRWFSAFAKKLKPKMLVGLDLSWNRPFGPEGVRTLLETEWAKQLELLSLSYCNIKGEGLKTLFGAKKMTLLTELVLEGNGLDTDAAVSAMRRSAPPRLLRLNLNNNRIGDVGMQAIAGAEWFKGITAFSFGHNGLSDKGAETLARSSNAASIEYLDLNYNDLTDDGAVALARSKYLDRLRHLNLNYNFIGNKGAAELVESKIAERLEFLGLWHNSVGDAGVKSIAKSKRLERLKELNLELNDFSDAGITAIEESKRLKSLKKLNVRNIKFGDKGLRAIEKLRKRGVEVEADKEAEK